MSGHRENYAVLLSGAGGIELGLARSLLEAEGIPCFHDAPFEMAEDLTHPPPIGVGNLYVPKAAHVRAVAVLDEAWGPGWNAAK